MNSCLAKRAIYARLLDCTLITLNECGGDLVQERRCHCDCSCLRQDAGWLAAGVHREWIAAEDNACCCGLHRPGSTKINPDRHCFCGPADKFQDCVARPRVLNAGSSHPLVYVIPANRCRQVQIARVGVEELLHVTTVPDLAAAVDCG